MNPAAPSSLKKIRIGDALVQDGILTPEQLSRALAEQKATGRMLGEMLVEQGVITHRDWLASSENALACPACSSAMD